MTAISVVSSDTFKLRLGRRDLPIATLPPVASVGAISGSQLPLACKGLAERKNSANQSQVVLYTNLVVDVNACFRLP